MRANAQRAHSYCAQACTGAHTWTCTRVHTRASHTCTPHALWVVTEAREAPLWGGGWGPGERPEGSPLGPREQVPHRVVPGQRSWERMSQGPGLSCHLLGQGRWRGGRGGERGRGGGAEGATAGRGGQHNQGGHLWAPHGGAAQLDSEFRPRRAGPRPGRRLRGWGPSKGLISLGAQRVAWVGGCSRSVGGPPPQPASVSPQP